MKITYKEFFEKSKKSPYLQEIVNQCVISAIEVALRWKKLFPDKLQADAGELMLNGLASLAKIEDIILTNREEINAEYMAKIFESYREDKDDYKKDRQI